MYRLILKFSIYYLSSLFKENATEEQRREFLDEIELMKKVGKHQNVLSFLGCWTTTKPLLLIIEYVAHGDMLHWLRRKRTQVTLMKKKKLKVVSHDLYRSGRAHFCLLYFTKADDTSFGYIN